MKNTLVNQAKIAAAEFFCETPEEICEELGITIDELKELLKNRNYQFYTDCRNAFEKAIISAQSTIIKKRVQENKE